MPPSPTATTPVKKAPKKATKKPTAPPDTPKESESAQENRPVVYPTLACCGVPIPDGRTTIAPDEAKTYLGWETEAEFTARFMAANLGMKDDTPYLMPNGSITTIAKAKVFGEAYMLLDENKNKVTCWNNLNNREFDRAWCLGLAQTILKGQWVGPTTVPGETVNGSTIVISKTGKVESGQHSLIGLILAHQMWVKNPAAHPFWPADGPGPVIEQLVITGISEDPRVIMTVDNCKPRSEADVFYTSDIRVNNVAFKDMLGGERRELSNMLQAAVGLLWTRTETQGYRTHPEAVAFLDRHKTLLKCLEQLYIENSKAGGRKLSRLRLSAGQCAAICYLMGSSGPGTDGDVYRNGFPPCEKGLDWTLLPRAKDFFAMLGEHADLATVRAALGKLVESDKDNPENQGLGGRLAEKLAILRQAWDVFKDTENPRPITEEDVEVHYTNLKYDAKTRTMVESDTLSLIEVADFGGIDVPEKPKGAATGGPEPKTPEELEAEKAAARLEKAKEAVAKIQAMRLGKDGKPVTVPTAPAK